MTKCFGFRTRAWFVFLLACGCSSGEDLGEVMPGHGGANASDGSGGVSNTAGSDSSSMGGAGSGEGGAKPVVTEPEPEPERVCEELEVASSGVFVSAEGGVDEPDVGTCGAPNLPCKTIGKGLTVAQANARSVVYVASGEYREDVTVALPVTIQGGWSEVGGAWSPICTGDRSERVVIHGVASSGAVRVTDVAGEVVLDSLKVEGLKAADGASSYGIFARGEELSLVLRDVVVQAAAGGDGKDGADAGPRARLPQGSPSNCDSGDGEAGAHGEPGEGAALRTFGSEGYVAGDGTAGGEGERGNNGTTEKACQQCATGTREEGLCTESCQPRSPETLCVTGRSGCGGAPGEGGKAGQGGGGSFAVYAWDASVTARGSRLVAADAGDGGDGQSGQEGGRGATADETYEGFCTICSDLGEGCNDAPAFYSAPGTEGGAGGDGGPGGGGSGGPSFALWLGGSAEGAVSMDSVLEHGEPGKGGEAPSDELHGSPGQAGKTGPL